MIRIHPCQNKHFVAQFTQSRNPLKSALSVLLQGGWKFSSKNFLKNWMKFSNPRVQPFFHLDSNLAAYFTLL